MKKVNNANKVKFIINYRGKGRLVHLKSATEVDAFSKEEAIDYFSKFYPAAELLIIKKKEHESDKKS